MIVYHAEHPVTMFGNARQSMAQRRGGPICLDHEWRRKHSCYPGKRYLSLGEHRGSVSREGIRNVV